MASRSRSASVVNSYSRVGPGIGFAAGLFEDLANFSLADFSGASFLEAIVQEAFEFGEGFLFVVSARVEGVLEEIVFEGNAFQGSQSFQALVLVFGDID